ncbi:MULTISPECIES: efflux RND transporter periplasmic adaptor subunit [Actibacterium]|uniref:Multidrug efflux system membrane fusion protein n=1 Tax=Actibacterium naphthalenivorans TaxID=1614693 RepID=A0A840CGF8_9RHOB|nr:MULTISPECIES: efflux RND transporter periplasmic adaptor subunit [Actibacterium]ALG90048.1 hemolysin D [Actibacterium sp. EMB200-NS6]MBB4021896.1 multidrug efflux system membrane fusion protein [Actibacterium naphthalenivorans]
MRIVSIITACLVVVALYLMIAERERVLEFAGREPPAPETAPVPEQAAAGPDAAPEDLRVSVVALHSLAQPVEDIVLVRGRTEAARMVEARAETSGRVNSAPLRKGAFVSEGQPVCTIDAGTRLAALAQAEAQLAEANARLPEAQARLSEAQALLSEAEINDRAAVRLNQEGYASETRVASTAAGVSSRKAGVESANSGLDAARAAISVAQAARAVAQQEIARLTIAAPFSGLLESDSAELGALLQPGSLCATVIQLDPIKLVGFVPETEVEKVSVGARAGARLATGRPVEGRVTFLSRSADAATRTFRVEVEIANPDLTIRDGQTVEMIIASGSTPAHLMPQSALTLDDDGRIGVRLIDADSRATFRPVTVMRDTVDGVWLTGLPEAADVIIIGQEYVTDGVPVRARFEEAAE